MILWVFVYISISLQKICVAWVVLNLFISANNVPFGLKQVTFCSCLVEGMSKKVSFQGLLLSIFILLNKSDSVLSETVRYNLKRMSLKSVAGVSVHLLLVDCVFFHP